MQAIRCISSVLLACAICFASCDDKNGTPEDPVDPVDPVGEQILFENGTQIGNGEQSFEIKGVHTLAKGAYLLKGWVYVANGASLTIEPGTVIKGDRETKAALIVEPGGKILAEGTAAEPIVFTSEMPKGERKPGDWGGLVICGRANNNNKAMIIEGGPRTTHGGSDDDDSSGKISYVRVEFAGYPFKTDQEINGITFGSVGRGTQVDHIQVSYCNDDSYEWFGGAVNCKYLVAYRGWDDDFDTDNGFSGNLQFLLGVRHPKIADTSLSNGFESDNNADGTTASPGTACAFSNVTLVGPAGQASDFANTSEYINGGGMNPENGSKTGTFQSAMQVRRNSRLNCFNSVALGFPVGLILDNQKGTTQTWATEGEMKIKNVFFAGMNLSGSDVNGSWKDAYSDNGKDMDELRQSFSHTYFLGEGLNNRTFEDISDLALNQPSGMEANPNWGPVAGSPLLGAANFDDERLSSGFDKVSYIGAFAGDSDADNWMKDWTNFDPQNAEY